MQAVSEPQVVALPRSSALLLLKVKWRAARNGFLQLATERPMQLAGTVGSLLMIWGGLYVLLWFLFKEVDRREMDAIVATPLIFSFFFLALTGMLAFSNAILCYGSLFKRKESEFLLATPVSIRDLVIVRYVESLAMSSWSLLLMGLPLMLAVGQVKNEEMSFYPLFLGIFVVFIPIPGALGLFLAWLMVRISPKSPKRTAALAGVLVLIVVGVWGYTAAQDAESSGQWLKRFYERVSIVQNPWLPPAWVSEGITAALEKRYARSAFYLWVTLSNALFFSAAAIGIVSSGYSKAFARAQESGSRDVRKSGRALSWIAEVLFAYLPRKQRLLAIKDLKTFFRDPLQWMQMAILVGLLLLYVSNVGDAWRDLAGDNLPILMVFINLSIVSLILATFTSRFVFPLVSLEGQQLWLLGLLPLQRSAMITAKFLYALTITVVTSLAVMGMSLYHLDLVWPMAVAHLGAVVMICIGLCGISIGTGARWPAFHERNPARIAGGFGGTLSLLLSVTLVVATLVCIGLMDYLAIGNNYGQHFTGSMVLCLSGVIGLNAMAAIIAMAMGIRHFKSVEW